MDGPNDHEARPAYCDHTPLQVSTIRTDAGYRIQCLNCGMVGPERESLQEALRARSGRRRWLRDKARWLRPALLIASGSLCFRELGMPETGFPRTPSFSAAR